MGNTVIQATNPVTAGVAFTSGEGNGAVLSGFKISVSGSRGITCQNTSPTISRNIIEVAGDISLFGAVVSDGGSPLVRNNIIRNCSGESACGLVYSNG